MTSAMENARVRTAGVCRRLVTVVAIGAGASALCAALALAKKQEPNPEFAPFADCPINAVPKISDCVVAQTTSGEFVMGSKTVTINKTITLQGGVREGSEERPHHRRRHPLEDPADGPGRAGGRRRGWREVTATTELTGPVLINEANLFERTGAAVTMPLRVKLSNPALGEETLHRRGAPNRSSSN